MKGDLDELIVATSTSDLPQGPTGLGGNLPLYAELNDNYNQRLPWMAKDSQIYGYLDGVALYLRGAFELVAVLGELIAEKLS